MRAHPALVVVIVVVLATVTLAGDPESACDSGYKDKSWDAARTACTEEARRGVASAQDRLAWMYRNGRGVTKDSRLAAMWFTRAAENGSTKAQRMLSIMYRMGDGVPPNGTRALKWALLAASGDADDQPARQFVDELREQLTSEQVAETERLALVWFDAQYREWKRE